MDELLKDILLVIASALLGGGGGVLAWVRWKRGGAAHLQAQTQHLEIQTQADLVANVAEMSKLLTTLNGEINEERTRRRDLEVRADERDQEIDAMRAQVADLEAENIRYKNTLRRWRLGIKKNIDLLIANDIEPAWQPEEDDEDA